MATEIDHTVKETQIVNILKDNTNLFTTTATDKTKLRSITVGEPSDNQPIPYTYMTFLSESIRKKGTETSNAVTLLEHDVRYDIWFYVDGKNSETAETNLNDFQKTILETLEADVQLKRGGSPIVDTSYPERINKVLDTKKKAVQGRIITLRCIISTN